MSQHLQVLVDAALVTVRKQGTRRLYQTNPNGLAGLRTFLERLTTLKPLSPGGELGQGEIDTASRSVEERVVATEIRINASAEAIFPYFTDPVLRRRWQGTDAVLDESRGGTYRVNTRLASEIDQSRYVEILPYSKIVFAFDGENGLGEPRRDTVEVSLTAEGANVTVVRLRHRNLPSEETRESYAVGWSEYLERLSIAVHSTGP